MSQDREPNKAIRFRVERPWLLTGILVGLGLACGVIVFVTSGYTGVCEGFTGAPYYCPYSSYVSLRFFGLAILGPILLAMLFLTPIGWVIGGVVLVVFILRQRAKHLESKAAYKPQPTDVLPEKETSPPDRLQL